MEGRSGRGATEGRAAAYRPPAPLDVGLTLSPLRHGAHDPTVRREGSIWWLAFRTAAGPATLRIAPTAAAPAGCAAAVELRAWGEGAERALAAAPELLGAADEADGFDSDRHPVVRRLARRFRGQRLTRSNRVFDALVPAVLEQKVTAEEAKASWRRLVRRYGEPAPGPAPEGMRVAPAADGWRGVPSWEWHRAGVTPARSDTIQRAARVASGLERTAGSPAPDSARALRTVVGIGPWTAAEITQRTHGDPDSVSVGDLHLCKRVGTALVGRRVDDDGMLELLEPWRGHRQRVVRLIEAAGIGYERHAPRLARVEHRFR